MKKLLFIVVAAVAMMACNSAVDSPDFPAKDKKAVDKATVEAVSQIGQSAAKIDTYLTNAGYAKVEGVVLNAPKRVPAKMKAPAADATYAVYVYGLDPQYIDEKADPAVAQFNNVISKGNTVVVVIAIFVDDQLMEMATLMSVGAGKKVNQKYVTLTNDMYATLPSSALQANWEGTAQLEDAKEAEYTKHDDFAAAISGAPAGVVADEFGYAITGVNAALMTYEGFAYMGYWDNPTAKEVEEQTKKGFEPYVSAEIIVADISLLMEE